MERNDNKLEWLTRIRELDLPALLDAMGYPVVKRHKNDTDYWYLSPFRNERTASFHINVSTNEWFDFGLMAGGNPVDFCLHYFRCTIPELAGHISFFNERSALVKYDPNLHEGQVENESKLVVKKVCDLYAYPLKNYLCERSIPLSVAEAFCKEVSYEIDGRSYYGIGFQNDAGGWEIRNKNFKQSSSPKDITCLGNGARSVHVFEGFVDFLSYCSIHPAEQSRAVDYVVLNGAGLFDRAIPFLMTHEHINLWLDRDVTGLAYRDYALGLDSRFIDRSGIYEKFKDLNEWLVHGGEIPRLRQKLGLRTI